MQRKLYIASYDICEASRLRRALYILRDYASGGQYSCFECFLSKAEKAELITRMKEIMDDTKDGFLLIAVKGTSNVIALGAGVPPSEDEFYMVG